MKYSFVRYDLSPYSNAVHLVIPKFIIIPVDFCNHSGNPNAEATLKLLHKGLLTAAINKSGYSHT